MTRFDPAARAAAAPWSRRVRFAVLAVAGLAFVACQNTPPVRVQNTLTQTVDLAKERPADIAVLPIEDATRGRLLGGLEETVRDGIARSLVARGYSPLRHGHVDALLRQAGVARDAAWSDDARVTGLAGRFGEEAVLAIRILDWDESKLGSTGWLTATAQVTMVGAESKALLWHGALTADVKAGGSGVTPPGLVERRDSAAREFARVLVFQLAPRQP